GDDISVEYALSSDTYKKLNNITDDGDYSNIWNNAGIGDSVKNNNVVNVVCSETADDDNYTVKANILLPATDNDENYVITFRFGNGTGVYTYYTVGYKVPAATEDIISFKEVENTNKQKVVFNQPLKILAVDSAKGDSEFELSKSFLTDKGGKYSIKYVDLLGNEDETTVKYTGFDKSWMPDIEKSNDDLDYITVKMDSGYKNAYGMTFETLKGDGYEITPTDDSLRTLSMKEALEKDGIDASAAEDVTVYKYAEAVVNCNTSFKINVYTGFEDGKYITQEMTYYVEGFDDDIEPCEIEYSRTSLENDDTNKYDPVDAKITIPEGAEILSADGELHTFYKNGSYAFKVKYANGVIAETVAKVDWIEAKDADNEDNSKPVLFGINYYIENDEQILNVTDKATEDGFKLSEPDTTSRVIANIKAVDFGSDGSFNPVIISKIESENKNVQPESEDSLALIFNGNDKATVTLSDNNGNTITKTITVDNIVEDANVTGTLRYVKCGLTQTKAYIDLEDGVTFRDLEGVQVLEKTDGTKEYYHLFTQSGKFTFKLKDENGNIADVITKNVTVEREPLILSETEDGRTPENPGWNQEQIVALEANMILNKLTVYDTDGNESDIKCYAEGKKAFVVFDKNTTVTLKAEAGNGSKAEYTVSTKALKVDSSKPLIDVDKEYIKENNTYKVTVTAKDKMPASSYTSPGDTEDGDNISIDLDTPVLKFTESDTTAEECDDGENVMLTKTATFYVTKTSEIGITAINMAKLENSTTVSVELDTEAPELSISGVDQMVTLIKTEKDVKVSMNEAGTITCSGTEINVEKDEEVSFTIKKNGLYRVVGTDESGNQSTDSFEIDYIDSEAPEINVTDNNIVIDLSDVNGDTDSEKLESIKSTLMKYVEVSDDISEVADIKVQISISKDINFSKSASYTANITATDEIGRVGEKKIGFDLVTATAKTYPEIEGFGANGKALVKNKYVSFTTDELTFTNIPKGAKVYYAKGDYTGAQMKYKSTLLSGNTLEIDSQSTYTVMLRLKDKSMHIYHVVNN
nr:hypothetical protein [Lachnospiraceae bacterium]